MNLDNLSLSLFEVSCDGSSCGSGRNGQHVHPRQDGGVPVARVVVRGGLRVSYEFAAESPVSGQAGDQK